MSHIFDTNTAIFMGAERSSKNCKVGIYGVPYDSTTSFRPGARFGPSAIRTASNGLESYCPQLNLDLDQIVYSDFGSLEIPFGDPEPVINKVREATESFLSNKIKPLLLGGEHSITAGAIEATAKFHPDLIVVQLDAHADLRDKWLGSRHNHACVMRRALEVLPSKTIFQLGVRSGTQKEFIEMKKHDRLIINSSQSNGSHLEKVLEPHLGKPIYLTVDLDWFDPSVLPGTGTPEPGGFLWKDFAEIVNILKKHKLVAADVVELAPQLDPSGSSEILAAKATRSIIMLLSME